MANKTMHHVVIGSDTFEIVDQYAREHSVTDTTLSISGSAADAKAVGDALALKADSADVTALGTRVTAVEGDVDDLKEDLRTFGVIDTTFNESLTAHETGKYINSSGNVAVYNSYSYSEPVPVKKGDIITARLYCPSTMYVMWYITSDYSSKEHVASGQSYSVETYTFTSDRDGYVCFNYLTAETHTLKVEHKTVLELEDSFNTLDDIVTASLVPTSEQTISTREAGKYLTISSINTWDHYSYSDPIPVTKGDTITITAYIGPNIYVYYCDADLSQRRKAISGDTYGVKTYQFTADRTGYIAINFGTNYTHTVKITKDIMGQVKRFNPLYGKMVVFCGDSICRGNTFNDKNSGWAGRCASILSCEYVNYGIGGSTITNNVTGGSTPTIYTQIETAYSEYPNADYIIFDGGCNDADLIGSIVGGSTPGQFGSWSPTDWSGVYDTDTFCGAFETICMHLSQYWLGKHVGYIVPHKQSVANDYSATGNNRRAYYETAIQICEKWGIPVLNLWDGCYLNPKHGWMCDTDNTMTEEEIYTAGFLYADRQHLTSEGYDFESAIVAEWIKGL